MRAVIVVRTVPQAEHLPGEDGQAVPGGLPDAPEPEPKPEPRRRRAKTDPQPEDED